MTWSLKWTEKPTAILYWLCISFCWGNLPGQNTRALSEFFSAPHSVRLSSKLKSNHSLFLKDPGPTSCILLKVMFWQGCLPAVCTSWRLVTQASPTLCNPVDYRPPRSSVHGDSPGKNTGVGCHFLLQGIFLPPGDWTCISRISCVGGGFFTTQPPGKPHLCLTKSQPSGTDPSSKNPFSSNLIPTFALALADANWLKLKLQSFGHLMQRTDSLEKTLWCWERLKAGGEGDDRGWDGWMASPTRWAWVWVNSGSWWWTGRPGVLWSMGSQRVGHDWATGLNWTEHTQHG